MASDTAAQQGEIWIDTFRVRVGSTVVAIHRFPMGGLNGDRDQDRWRVVPPKWADHVGEERWFENHVAAQQFAGYMAEMLDKQRAAWDRAMLSIRQEWKWHLAERPDGATDR